MTTKNSYWDNRFLDIDKETFKNSEEYVKKLHRIYLLETQHLKKEIYNHLVKLQDEAGGISLAEAKKMLNDEELAIFKMSLDEFIKKAQGDITPEIERELNIVSRRVRVSRLQAMEVELKKAVAKLMSKEEKGVFIHLSKVYENKYYKELYGLQTILGYEAVQAVNKEMLDTVVRTPWAPDGANFSERIWGRGDKLVNLLQENLSRDVARGAAPDESIKTIAEAMNTSKANAGRLVMTESAAINSKATKDSYDEMGLEKYRISATLDLKTSDVCRKMDFKVFDRKDYKIGVTANPFHPSCRTTTVPYFDDEISQRLNTTRMSRDPVTGKSVRVEYMSYEEWHEKYVKTNPEALANEKAWKNRNSDKKQYDRYKETLGKNTPKSFEDFQKLKYNDSEKWGGLRLSYKDENLRNEIKTNYNLKIADGRQGKHIIGHNNYIQEKSYLIDGVNPQELVDKYAGTGEIIRDKRGNWINKQMFKDDELVGFTFNIGTGKYEETKYFSIEYSKTKGTHIVPRREPKDD